MKNQWYVYFLIHRKEVVYIGMSCNLRSRTTDHLLNKEFNSVRWIDCQSKYKAAEYEKRWILKFMPKYNKEYYLMLKRQQLGIIKKYLPKDMVDLLQSIHAETGTPMEELLNNPLVGSLYVYEKHIQKP